MDIEHEKRLTSIEARSKSNSHRIDEVIKRQDSLDELVGTVKALVVREETVEADVKEIKADVKEINSKPGKRWEAIVEKIIVTIAAAVIGFVLAKFGF